MVTVEKVWKRGRIYADAAGMRHLTERTDGTRAGDDRRNGGSMQKIGIGYEDYREFIDDKMYYVDKTNIIRDLLEKGGKVTLFTRPRRFGKTLALSTLRTFFELEYDRNGNVIDKKRYFEGKKIMEAGENVLSKMHPNRQLQHMQQNDSY